MSKHILSALILVPLSGVVQAASEPSEQAIRHARQDPNRSGAPITIPLELRDNFAFLVATVDGVDVRLKFDLGSSSALLLQQSVVDRIKAVPHGEHAKFQSIDGVFESPQFKVSRVQLGSAVFADVITTLDAPRPGYEPGPFAQGFLGTGLLKSYEVVLDYPHRTMTLVPRSNESVSGSCKGTVVPFSQSSSKWRGEPVTEAGTDLGPLILWWDTGAPVSALRKTAIRDVRSQSSGDTVTMNRLTLGGGDFGPWQFEIWDMSLPGFDGFIGYDFFAKHVVCIDFPGSRVVIRQPGQGASEGLR